MRKRFGRPSVITPVVIKLLMEAFAFGCNDEEACVYAGISPATLYNYQKKDQEFVDLKRQCRMQPILKARIALYRALSEPAFAWKYLCKKTNNINFSKG